MAYQKSAGGGAHPAEPANARLIVHVDKSAVEGATDGRFPLKWLRVFDSSVSQCLPRTPVSLTIADLQGHDVRAIEDCGPLTVVALPAGTYHVDARVGDLRRRYTLTLEKGSFFDLHLNLDTGSP